MLIFSTKFLNLRSIYSKSKINQNSEKKIKPEFVGDALMNVQIEAYKHKKQCLNCNKVFRSRKAKIPNMFKRSGVKDLDPEILQEALIIIFKLLERQG